MPVTYSRTYFANFYRIIVIITISSVMCPVSSLLFVHHSSSFELKFEKLLSSIQQHITELQYLVGLAFLQYVIFQKAI